MSFTEHNGPREQLHERRMKTHSSKLTLRRRLYVLHLSLGLAAGLWFSVAGVTGSVLVFRHEVDRVLNPQLLTVEPRGEMAPLETVLRSVENAFPSGRPLRIGFPRAPDGTFEVWLDSNDGRRVYVNPYTCEVLGSRLPNRTFIGFLRAIHVELLAGATGQNIAGIFGLVLLVLIVTGYILWWPGLRAIPRSLLVRWRTSWKVLVYQAHRTAGVFVGMLLFVTAVTGVALVFDGSFHVVVSVFSASAPTKPPAVRPQSGSHVSLNAVQAVADSALPEAQITRIILPAEEDAAITVRKRFPGEAQYNGKSYIYIDSSSGEVLQVVHAYRGTVGTRLANLRYPIHTGEIGGYSLRVLVALLGLTPALLTITGAASWWLRRRSE